MRELIKFEFLKLYKSKMNRIVTACLFAFISFFCILSIAGTSERKDGKWIFGFSAIREKQAVTDGMAGILSEERITADLQEFQRLWNNPDNKKDAGTVHETFSSEFEAYYDKMYLYLFWLNHNYDEIGYRSADDNIKQKDFSGGAKFYETRQEKIHKILSEGTDDWKYSEAEQAYWQGKTSRVKIPFTYGNADGWQKILDGAMLLMYVTLAICMMVAGTYAGEYSNGTDHIILTSKYGKTKIVTAKNAAAILYSLATLTFFVVVLCAAMLGCYGTEGAALPIQLCDAAFPYPLNYFQAVLTVLTVYYVVCTGMVVLTLFLSARMNRSLPVFAAILGIFTVGILFRESMTNGVYNHIRLLLPYYALNLDAYLFENMVSYPFGKIVVSHVEMLALTYALIICALLPFAGRGFRRRQVH